VPAPRTPFSNSKTSETKNFVSLKIKYGFMLSDIFVELQHLLFEVIRAV